MSVELHTISVQSENFQLEDMDGELLLYHVSSTRTLHLNSSAALVWQLCDGQRSVGDIIGMLQENFPDAGQELETDVIAAVNELTDGGVLGT